MRLRISSLRIFFNFHWLIKWFSREVISSERIIQLMLIIIRSANAASVCRARSEIFLIIESWLLRLLLNIWIWVLVIEIRNRSSSTIIAIIKSKLIIYTWVSIRIGVVIIVMEWLRLSLEIGLGLRLYSLCTWYKINFVLIFYPLEFTFNWCYPFIDSRFIIFFIDYWLIFRVNSKNFQCWHFTKRSLCTNALK